MKPLLWKSAQAPYIKNPAFMSYGAFEEKRPVRVDCSLGINPLPNLYNQATLTMTAASYGRYPRGGAHGNPALAAYVASRWPSVTPDSICFGSGSQGVISSLSRILGGSGVTVLGLIPQFIPALLEFSSAGASISTVSLPKGGFAIDVDAMITALTPATTAAYLDNPHNPTGQVLPLEAVARLADACQKNGTLLIVDEAYGDFVEDANSALNLPHGNLICMRSFSKGCGLAGLRVGYIVIRDAELRACYRELGLHFSSSAAGADMAAQLLPRLDLAAMRQEVTALKTRVLEFITPQERFSVATTHPGTPIFLVSWKETGGNLYDALMEVGIQTEPGMFFALEGHNAVRLRAPMSEQFDEFCALWRERFGA